MTQANSNDDLETIKEILFTVARRYETISEVQDRSERRMEAVDRRLEALAEHAQRTDRQLQQITEIQARTDERLDRITQKQEENATLIRTNALAVEALAGSIVEMQAQVQQVWGRIQEILVELRNRFPGNGRG